VLGKRLRQIRLARGFTQETLVEAIGNQISKQAISQYENGRTTPKPSVLRRLAQALRVNPAELLSEPQFHIQPVAFRCQKALSQHNRSRIEQLVSIELERRLQIEQLLGISTVLPLQKFPVHTELDAEKAAGLLRQQWQLGVDPISSVVQTLETHGVHVIPVDAPETFDGVAAIAYAQDGVPIGAAIATRTGVPGERQRLSLAHELGHLVLKVDEGLDEEKIAFRFGGAFLIPAETLFGEIGPRRVDISLEELILLKQRYGMSIQALLYRMRILGVISGAYYTQWMQNLSRQGWRKHEPNELPEEAPQRFRQLLLRAVAEQLLPTEQAEQMLGEPLRIHAPRPLSARRALLMLPPEERARILQVQAERAAQDYERDIDERLIWQGGDFIDESEPETR